MSLPQHSNLSGKKLLSSFLAKEQKEKSSSNREGLVGWKNFFGGPGEEQKAWSVECNRTIIRIRIRKKVFLILLVSSMNGDELQKWKMMQK